MSLRNKIISSLLVMIGFIFTYMAFQSNYNKIGYYFVAFYNFLLAFLVTKKQE